MHIHAQLAAVPTGDDACVKASGRSLPMCDGARARTHRHASPNHTVAYNNAIGAGIGATHGLYALLLLARTPQQRPGKWLHLACSALAAMTLLQTHRERKWRNSVERSCASTHAPLQFRFQWNPVNQPLRLASSG